MNSEMDSLINGDMLWTLASICFVAFYMWIHTGSVFLTITGMVTALDFI